MKKTLLFLVYSCFFVNFFGIAAHQDSQCTQFSNVMLHPTKEAPYSLFMPAFLAVVNQNYFRCSPSLRNYCNVNSFEGGKKRALSPVPSPTTVAFEEDTFERPALKRQVSSNEFKGQQDLLKASLLAVMKIEQDGSALRPKLNPSDTDNVVMRRQVSFNSQFEVREGNGSSIIIDTAKEEPATLRRVISGNLPRVGSGLQECVVPDPSPPPTPAKECFEKTRLRAGSDDSGEFFMGVIPSATSTPVGTDRKSIVLMANTGTGNDIISLRRQYSAGSSNELRQFHPEEEDTVKQFVKKNCGTPNLSPVTSPDTKN